jgi:hypothetical protein
MTPLAEATGSLAEWFRRASPIPGDSAIEAACARIVAGNDRLTPAEQVDIYRRQFWLRHVDSLRDDYPGLEHVLGTGAFEALCRAYLEQHPPSTPSLRDLGADIVRFAERWDGLPPDRRAIALDMIRYEHAMIDLFDGPSTPPLDPAKLAGMPDDAWDRARIVLDPLLVPMELAHPVHRVRFAVKAGQRPALPAPEPSRVVLFRKDLVIHFEELEPEPFELLGLLARGEPLVAACSRLASGLDDAQAAELEARVSGWFQRWASLGWIVDVIP